MDALTTYGTIAMQGALDAVAGYPVNQRLAMLKGVLDQTDARLWPQVRAKMAIGKSLNDALIAAFAAHGKALFKTLGTHGHLLERAPTGQEPLGDIFGALTGALGAAICTTAPALAAAGGSSAIGTGASLANSLCGGSGGMSAQQVQLMLQLQQQQRQQELLMIALGGGVLLLALVL